MDHFIDAYLEYHAQDPRDGMPQIPTTLAVHPSAEQCVSTVAPLDIELVDMFSKYGCISYHSCLNLLFLGRHRKCITPAPRHIYPNETLIQQGYIGSSPFIPSVTILIQTLATFHQQYHMCPHFSIQAWAKTLCHLHQVSLVKFHHHPFVLIYSWHHTKLL